MQPAYGGCCCNCWLRCSMNEKVLDSLTLFCAVGLEFTALISTAHIASREILLTRLVPRIGSNSNKAPWSNFKYDSSLNSLYKTASVTHRIQPHTYTQLYDESLMLKTEKVTERNSNSIKYSPWECKTYRIDSGNSTRIHIADWKMSSIWKLERWSWKDEPKWLEEQKNWINKSWMCNFLNSLT